MNSIHITPARYIIKAIAALAVAACCAVHGYAQETYDQTRVAAALHQWTRKLPKFDGEKPTVLFATSTAGCTPCCATAINHAISILDGENINANVLVVVATPLPKEGLAIRKKFRTANVSEDTAGVLRNVFQANPLFPDMYIIDAVGHVLLYHHDLQHNMVDTLNLKQYMAPAVPGDLKTSGLHSVVQLHEDDDNIISELRSEYLDLKKGTLEFLETRQNSIYRFDLRTGKILKVIPADESLALHFKKPDDRTDFWEDFSSHQQSMVKYESIIHPGGTDTSYVIAELFSGYAMEVDTSQRLDTSLTFYRNNCVLAMFGDSVISVDSIPSSPWIMVGSALPLGSDIISPCIWEGILDENIDPGFKRDSAYSFIVIPNSTLRPGPVVRIDDLEGLSRRPYNARAFGPMCTTSRNELLYINPRNGIFVKGRKSGDSMICTLLQPGGILGATGLFATPEKAGNAGHAGQNAADSLIVADIATNNSHVHLLLLGRRAQDSTMQLAMQTYSMAGAYIGESIIRTDSDPILSASITGYDSRDMFLLLKQRYGRWKIARLPLSDTEQ